MLIPWVQMPMAPHSKATGFRGPAVDYTVFPFSSNPPAPHYPPLCLTNLLERQWSARLLVVHGNMHKSRSGF
jgi:hypothetical protein